MTDGADQVDRFFQKASHLFHDLPVGVGILDGDGRFLAGNDLFFRTLERSTGEILGKSLGEIFRRWHAFERDPQEKPVDLEALVRNEDSRERISILVTTQAPARGRTFRLTLKALSSGEGRRILLTLEEETQAQKMEQKIRLLQMLAKHIRSTPDLNRLLFTILTCVTAGRALSFSRAFIFLPCRGGKELRCRMAVGPGSPEEAGAIWARLAREDPDLDTLLIRYSEKRVRSEAFRAFPELMRHSIPVNSQKSLVARTFREKAPTWTKNAWEDPREDPAFVRIFRAKEFVAVPMIAAGKNMGVITADNLYLDRPIASNDIEFLLILAGQAALALENAFAQATLHSQVKRLARMNKSLTEARSKLILSEKMAAVGSVAARITHEIRNPLTTIGGFARRILKEAPQGTKIRRNAGIIVEEVDRLETLLQGILDFSRPSQVRPGPVDLTPIAQDVVETFSGQTQERVRMEILDLTRGKKVYADPAHVRQILINLVKNALEAVGREGTVRILLREEGERLSLAVKDDGPGIPKENLKRLFEPFFTTKITGTGLGLPITRALVEANKGKIHVESRPGEGTIFKVSLPAFREEEKEGGRQENETCAQ